MTVIRAPLNDELETALERYRESHSEAPEVIVQKALKRFLLEEGFPAEDEELNDEELGALEQHRQGESAYDNWQDVKKTL